MLTLSKHIMYLIMKKKRKKVKAEMHMEHLEEAAAVAREVAVVDKGDLVVTEVDTKLVVVEAAMTNVEATKEGEATEMSKIMKNQKEDKKKENGRINMEKLLMYQPRDLQRNSKKF